MENMVAEIPAYRAEVEHRQDFARTRTEDSYWPSRMGPLR